MNLTVALLLAALVVAGHVAQPAWGDASLANSTMPVVEAQLPRKKLAPGNDIMWPGSNESTKIVVTDSFDLFTSNKKKYMAFMSDLDYHVNATAARWIRHRPVLGRQYLRDPPATWFSLTLTGLAGDRVIFFMRSDNLYISAFMNQHGRVFAFVPQEGHYRIGGATFLSFGGGYRDFFGGVGARGLLNVRINRYVALLYLRVLANFQGGPDGHLKMPAAFFVLVISEAERFVPLRDAVFRRWDEPPTSIDDQLPHHTFLIDLVVNWRTFSCAILSWDQHAQSMDAWTRNEEARDIRIYGVLTPEDAISKLNPILQVVAYRCSWTPRP